MRRLLGTLTLCFLAAACADSGPAATTTADALRPWIDTHAHPMGVSTTCTSVECVDDVVALMDTYGVERAILIHPPAPAAGRSPEQEADVKNTVSLRPDRFYYGAGGNVLNSIIEGVGNGPVPEEARSLFESTLQGLVDGGGFVSFGETAALHLSYEPGHAFEETAPDSALFLRLAEAAAGLGVPLDIHIDVVVETTATPQFFLDASPTNPETIQGNVAGLEALLAANREARIVLAHVGRDTTGDMSADLIDRLMRRHSNLYLQLAPADGPLFTETAILDADRAVRDEWLTLLETFRDRIVLGSDVFFSGTGEDERVLASMQLFLQQLPEDLAFQIGCVNPVEIYSLPAGC